jgi:hypothetical protein
MIVDALSRLDGSIRGIVIVPSYSMSEIIFSWFMLFMKQFTRP